MAELDDIISKYSSPTLLSTEPEQPRLPAPIPPPQDLDSVIRKYGENEPVRAGVPATPQAPPTETPPPSDSDAGFWNITGRAALRGMLQGSQEFGSGLSLAGGTSLKEAAAALPPEQQDEVSKLLNQKVSEGWSNPKWWGAQIAHGVGASSPSLALGGLGALVGTGVEPGGGTLVGGAAGFGTGTAIQTIVPAFARAKARGLSDDDALTAALTETGITTAFATAMGLVPGMSVYGKTVEGALKRPIAEALTQMGIIQPSIGVGQGAAVAAAQGRTISPDEALTSYVTNIGVGAAYTGLHIGASHLIGRPVAEAPPDPNAILGDLDRIIQSHPPDTRTEIEPTPGTYTEVESRTLDKPMWFSRARQIVDEKGPNSASGGQWLATLRNAGAKDEELDALRLPTYLQDANGNISKADLIAHMEDNQIRINDIVREWDDAAEAQYGQFVTAGPKDKYIEMKLQWDRPADEFPRDWKVTQFTNGEWGVQNSEGKLMSDTYGSRSQAVAEAMQNAQRGFAKAEGYRPTRYYGPHFEEPDLLATIRATGRMDRDGRRTLHLEEIQSDWMQLARELGFKGDNPERDAARQAAIDKFRKLNLEGSAHEAMASALSRNLISREEHDLVMDRINELQTGKAPPVKGPFKTSWQELAFKRALRYAADNGYERVSWSNGEQQISRYRMLNEGQKRGMREFYGTPGNLSTGVSPQRGILDGIASRWGKRLAMESGTTKLGSFEDLPARTRLEDVPQILSPVRYLDVNPAVSDRIREGFAMFSRKGEVRITRDGETGERKSSLDDLINKIGFDPEAKPEPTPAREMEAKRGPSIDELVKSVEKEAEAERLRPAGTRVGNAIKELAKALKLNVPLEVRLQSTMMKEGGETTLGVLRAFQDGSGYHILLNLSAHKNAEDLYATAAHELGHIVVMEHFANATPEVMASLLAAHRKWREDLSPDPQFQALVASRDNAITQHYKTRGTDDFPILSLTPERQRYWTSFEEWMAEQTARWATTSQKPLSIVDKFFQGLGVRIREIVDGLRERLGLKSTDPHKVVGDWLDSFAKDAGPFAADAVAGMQRRTTMDAQRAFEKDGTPNVPPAPQTDATGGGRGIIGRMFPRGEGAPPNWRADAAHADRMNRFYQVMLGLHQLAKLNPHISGLQHYRELVALMDVEKKMWANEGMETLHAWKRLHGKQGDAVAGLIDDYMNMTYLSPNEVKAGTFRKPNVAEFQELLKKNGVNDQGRGVFKKIVDDFDRVLDRYHAQLTQEAYKIRDPVKQAQKLQDVQTQIDDLRSRPYFPAMRFGDHTLTVRDAAGNVIHNETFENARKQNAAAKEIEKTLGKGETMRLGLLPKDARPLVGMPPGILDLMADKLQLSPTQRDALDVLRFEKSPAQTIRHRFQLNDRTPGYSTDFKRAYANWMFHAGNQFARVKYVDGLRDFVRQVREESKTMPDGVKRDQIGNFMSDHLRNVLDPKPDFAALRSLAFTWYLGFSPAAATLNLSQTVLMTYPFLAQHFGDVRAIAAMAKASARLSTYYRKGTLTGATDGELRAMGEGIREGVITEALAPQLAATADGRNLSQGFGGNAAERMWNGFNQASSFFFEHTEQTNRRIAFRAAYDLALSNPDAKYVQQMVNANPLQYQRLRDKGWTHQEAAAFTAAKDAVESTQFVYSQYARPQFMRGRLGSLFVFKSFTQNTLFNLWNYPSAAARTLLIMGAVGGLLNMPGVEDINGILRAIGFHLFGKDFDLQDTARNFVLDLLGGRGDTIKHPGQLTTDQGHIRPDLLLHGLSRVGYGIPAVLDMMGNLAGMEHLPYPVSDRHANIGMGNILPIEPGIMFAPQVTGMGASGPRDTSGQLLRETQRASGAIFGLGFALYKAIMNSQLDATDFKRWEGIVPSALRNLSQSYRYYSEGKERSRSGAAIVRFDPNEPEQMMEILAKAMGYQSLRLTSQWDRMTAEREATAFWDLRREGLLRQAWSARGDSEAFARVRGAIKKYNEDLPPEARGKAISGDTLLKSFQTRATTVAKQEAGVPLATGNIPISQSIQKMFPEAQVGAGRRVR